MERVIQFLFLCRMDWSSFSLIVDQKLAKYLVDFPLGYTIRRELSPIKDGDEVNLDDLDATFFSGPVVVLSELDLNLTFVKIE